MTLSQLAFPRESDPNSQAELSQGDNIVVKKTNNPPKQQQQQQQQQQFGVGAFSSIAPKLWKSSPITVVRATMPQLAIL